jgi:hypothetical protein
MAEHRVELADMASEMLAMLGQVPQALELEPELKLETGLSCLLSLE